MRYGELDLLTFPSSAFSPMITKTWPKAGTPSCLVGGVAELVLGSQAIDSATDRTAARPTTTRRFGSLPQLLYVGRPWHGTRRLSTVDHPAQAEQETPPPWRSRK